MDNLQKIFWVALTVTIILWIGVGVYYFMSIQPSPSPESQVVLPPAPTVFPPASWQAYQTDQYSIKYPKTWNLRLPTQSKTHAFTLLPSEEENNLYPAISLFVAKNPRKLSASEWAKLYANQEDSFQPVLVAGKEGIKIDEASRSTIYVNDETLRVMYRFVAHSPLVGVSELSATAKEKFAGIVSTFKIVQ